MSDLHVELNCKGYFQFGTGWMLAKVGPDRPGAEHCNSCPVVKECWELHKKRAAKLFPAIEEEIQELMKTMKGPELMKHWHDKYGVPDHYTGLMVQNLQQGSVLSAGGKLEDYPELKIFAGTELREVPLPSLEEA